jgi:hypothetical protein
MHAACLEPEDGGTPGSSTRRFDGAGPSGLQAMVSSGPVTPEQIQGLA